MENWKLSLGHKSLSCLWFKPNFKCIENFLTLYRKWKSEESLSSDLHLRKENNDAKKYINYGLSWESTYKNVECDLSFFVK